MLKKSKKKILEQIAAALLARESYANKQKNEHAILLPLLFTNKKVILSLVVYFWLNNYCNIIFLLSATTYSYYTATTWNTQILTLFSIYYSWIVPAQPLENALPYSGPEVYFKVLFKKNSWKQINQFIAKNFLNIFYKD